ncbi:hypothetical protein C8F01DRAFT_1158444 [Mycena amicta]|nr:hypothetical protein C8F01DRAFT_1158444 [Mycena amicta]
MPVPAFLLLLCSCLRPAPDDDHDASDAVIPNERSRLIESTPSPSAVAAVDHQKLNDRFGTIVRAKEGRMVSVSSRAPFVLHDEEVLDDDGIDQATPTPTGVTLNRRPPVLTMTPARARSQGSLFQFSDTQSITLSRASSRSSSRARPPPSTSTSNNSQSSQSGARAGPTASEWFGDSESGSGSIEEEPSPSPSPSPEPGPPNSTPVPPRAPIAALASHHVVVPAPAPPPPVLPPDDTTPKATADSTSGLPSTGITFDWDD